MAPPRLRLRTSNCSLLLIYLPRKDGSSIRTCSILCRFMVPFSGTWFLAVCHGHEITTTWRCQLTHLPSFPRHGLRTWFGLQSVLCYLSASGVCAVYCRLLGTNNSHGQMQAVAGQTIQAHPDPSSPISRTELTPSPADGRTQAMMLQNDYAALTLRGQHLSSNVTLRG